MRAKGVVGVVLLIFGLGTILLGSMFCMELLRLGPHFRGILAVYDLKFGLHSEAELMSRYDLLAFLSIFFPISGLIVFSSGTYLVAKGMEQKPREG